MRRRLVQRLEREWQLGGPLSTLLLPVSWVYAALVSLRRTLYRAGLCKSPASALPVVVIGNLTVGGSGKTPLVGWLVEAFRERGWNPGIVARGYGGEPQTTPRLVCADDSPATVGDEPLLLHRLTGAPVCVCSARALAVEALARETDCDLILSDDGLQHLAMARHVEVIVVDAAAGFGNGRLLPAGPLRERGKRLYLADAVAFRHASLAARTAVEGPALPASVAPVDRPLPAAFGFALGEPRLRRMGTDYWQPLASLAGRRVHAVAGIARPVRFFDLLREHGLQVIEHPLPDHHAHVLDDVRFDDALPVLVTSKDAVKLDGLASDGELHEVAVDVQVNSAAGTVVDRLSDSLRSIRPLSRARAQNGS